jgi:hypothetical protein
LNRYTGHIHQLRYRHGRTYGDETHRLASDFPHLTRAKSALATVKFTESDPYETQEFPDGMLPGYTGDRISICFFCLLIKFILY